MNNKDVLEEYLLIIKSTIEVYIHGTIESSNIDVREYLWNALDETIKHQSSTYDIMKEKDIYKIENIDSSLIEKTINKLCKN